MTVAWVFSWCILAILTGYWAARKLRDDGQDKATAVVGWIACFLIWPIVLIGFGLAKVLR